MRAKDPNFTAFCFRIFRRLGSLVRRNRDVDSAVDQKFDKAALELIVVNRRREAERKLVLI